MSNETRQRIIEQMDAIEGTLTHLRACIERGIGYIEGEDYENIPDEEMQEEGEDPHDVLVEYPLEIVDERGRLYTVVFCTGGPHVEVTKDGAYGACIMSGYWGGEKVTRGGDIMDWVMDYYLDC